MRLGHIEERRNPLLMLHNAGAQDHRPHFSSEMMDLKAVELEPGCSFWPIEVTTVK